MLIKNLKDYTFEFDEDDKVLEIIEEAKKESVKLDKIRMLSLMRFMIRILARLSVRHVKKSLIS